MRSVDPDPVVIVPVSDTVPLIKSSPWFTTFADIVPPTTFNDWFDGIVMVPPATVVFVIEIGAVMRRRAYHLKGNGLYSPDFTDLEINWDHLLEDGRELFCQEQRRNSWLGVAFSW